jgi:hypothetical protein
MIFKESSDLSEEIKALLTNKLYHTVGTIPKSNIKIVDTDKIDTTNT